MPIAPIPKSLKILSKDRASNHYRIHESRYSYNKQVCLSKDPPLNKLDFYYLIIVKSLNFLIF